MARHELVAEQLRSALNTLIVIEQATSARAGGPDPVVHLPGGPAVDGNHSGPKIWLEAAEEGVKARVEAPVAVVGPSERLLSCHACLLTDGV